MEPIEPTDTGPQAGPSAGASPVRAEAVAISPSLEGFAKAYLIERRRERRWRLLLRVLWWLLALAVAYAAFKQTNPVSVPRGPHTALVEVHGEIGSDSPSSADSLIPALREAFKDAGAKAVVMRINSPGGSPVQAGLVYDEIHRLKTLHKKPVYAVCEEVCASAAYYIASVADEIYVDKASMVGSIGVLIDGFGFVGTMEKLGVERRLITAGNNKGLLDPFSPLDERQRAYAQAMIDGVHKQFIEVVKAGRGTRLKEDEETFSGLFWNGSVSVEKGLADGLGSLDYVAREVVKAEEVIDYTPRENVAERLAKRFGAAVGQGAVKALRSLPSVH